MIFAVDPSTLGGYTGLAGAGITVVALARFYWIYTRKIEGRLRRCENETDHNNWQKGFLENLLRAHGIYIPKRYYSDRWRDEPNRLTNDDLTDLR